MTIHTDTAGQIDLKSFNEKHQNSWPKETIKEALEMFPGLGISFSGAEDVVLIDMAVKLNPNVTVFTLDTGRLHSETYEFIEQVRKHYGIQIVVMTPESVALQEFVAKKGLFSFFEDGHNECCGIRKIEPLKRMLKTLPAWMTGQRKDQSPGTRSDIDLVEVDSSFEGVSNETPLIKFNPLANWTSQDVWDYIKMFDVPFNKLHEQGFKSIGCQPCTRPTLPNQHEREGRWWWEQQDAKECGLHAANIISKG